MNYIAHTIETIKPYTTNLDQDRLMRIANTYAPYDTLEPFWHGVQAYFTDTDLPWHQYDGYKAQAYDRGLNAASRYQRGENPR